MDVYHRCMPVVPTKKRLRLSSQPFLGLAERTRFELAVELPLRQFSKLLVSATHPPLRKLAEVFSIATAKVLLFFIPARFFAIFFEKTFSWTFYRRVVTGTKAVRNKTCDKALNCSAPHVFYIFWVYLSMKW